MVIYIKIPEHTKKPEIFPAGSCERHIIPGENGLPVANARGRFCSMKTGVELLLEDTV